TEEILQGLIAIQDSPWALIWADDLRCGSIPKAAAKFARMLKHYKRADGERLKPRTIRIGNDTPRGFHRSDFGDAWNRYLPSSSEKAATSATAAPHDATDVAAVADVAASGEDDDGGFGLHYALDPSIGDEPHDDNTDVNCASQPRSYKR